MRLSRGLAAVVTSAFALGLLAGCSEDADAPPADLLAEARTTLDTTTSLHVTVAGADLPADGTALVKASGDVARPDKFDGTLQIRQSGLSLSVDVISVGGTVWAKLPIGGGFSEVDPADYGVADPGRLLDPEDGVAGLLADATELRPAGAERLDGEPLDRVEVTIPGATVDRVLASADPAQPVTARLGISRDAPRQLRRAVLTGPFLDAAVMTTYTIVLDRYGEPVAISAPG